MLNVMSETRRDFLRILAGAAAGAAGIPILGSGGRTPTGDDTDSGAGAEGDGGVLGTCAAEIPAETAGPYPGDGSNGPNVLVQSGVVRSDIRTSFGGAT